MKIRLVFPLTILLASITASADVGRVLGFEQTLEQRIYRAIQPFDPDAQVYVRVQMKTVSVKLPGVSADFFGAPAINEIREQDIQNINVRILSSLDPFPNFLKQEIEENLKYPSVRTSVEIVALTPEAREIIKSRDLFQRALDQATEMLGKKWPVVFGLGGVGFALVMTGFALLVLWTLGFWRGQMAKLLAALEKEDGSSSAREMEKAADKTAEVPVDKKLEGGLDLPENGVLELLADCYWTQNDGYAHWLWENMRAEQKKFVLSNWSQMADYAEFIMSVRVHSRTDHLHPYYLNPLSLKSVGPEQLAQFVEKKQSLYNLLPPLRRETLSLPLAKKMQLFSSKKEAIPDGLFANVTSSPRVLEQAASVGVLTLEDDLALWQNPNMVPDRLKPSVATLVWVAKLNATVRAELLATYSAADLAKSWVAPEEVLSEILIAIPEKKQKLLLSYVQANPPSRQYPAFIQLAREGATRLIQPDSSASGDSSAKVA